MSNGYQRLCHQHKKFIQYSGGFRPVAVWHGSKANLQNPETTRQNLSAHRSEAGSRFALVAHMFARKYFSFVFAHSSFSNPQVNANPSSANYLRLAFYWRFKPSFHLTQWEFLASAHIFSIIVNLAKIKKSFFFHLRLLTLEANQTFKWRLFFASTLDLSNSLLWASWLFFLRRRLGRRLLQRRCQITQFFVSQLRGDSFFALILWLMRKIFE